MSSENKIPPHSKKVEEAVLGIMLENPYAIPEVFSQITRHEVFYFPFHQYVFISIKSLYDKNRSCDMISVVQECTARYPDEINVPFQVMQLTNAVTSQVGLKDHVRTVVELYIKRESILIAHKLMADAYSLKTDVFDLIHGANNSLLKVQEDAMSGREVNITTYVMRVKENRERISVNGMIGLNTGFRVLNQVISGWVAPDLVIIAARPGAGKTALVISTLKTVAVEQRKPVAIFSLEMSGEQLVERLESVESGIFHEKLRHNKLSDYDLTKLSTTENRICESPIYIEDRPGVNIRHIRSRSIYLKQRHKIEMIIVDYLQLMSGVDEKGKNREQVISEISRGLKEVAKELNVPVIALSQLSREVEKRPDKMPQLSDLRESGSIEQDADEVIFLMRPEYYGFTDPIEIDNETYSCEGLVVCKIAKNRHGVTKVVPMRFTGPLMKFTDYETESTFGKDIPKQLGPGNWKELKEETPF